MARLAGAVASRGATTGKERIVNARGPFVEHSWNNSRTSGIIPKQLLVVHPQVLQQLWGISGRNDSFGAWGPRPYGALGPLSSNLAYVFVRIYLQPLRPTLPAVLRWMLQVREG